MILDVNSCETIYFLYVFLKVNSFSHFPISLVLIYKIFIVLLRKTFKQLLIGSKYHYFFTQPNALSYPKKKHHLTIKIDWFLENPSLLHVCFAFKINNIIYKILICKIWLLNHIKFHSLNRNTSIRHKETYIGMTVLIIVSPQT